MFQLDLQLQDDTGGDISSFITNGEWDLLGKTGPDRYNLVSFLTPLFSAYVGS